MHCRLEEEFLSVLCGEVSSPGFLLMGAVFNVRSIRYVSANMCRLPRARGVRPLTGRTTCLRRSQVIGLNLSPLASTAHASLAFLAAIATTALP